MTKRTCTPGVWMRSEPEPWEGHPEVPVSDAELQRLIGEDWERTAGR